MASKKYEELNAMSVDELQAELKETRDFLQKKRFEHAIKGLDNPLILRNVRRDVARINTVLRQREIANMSDEEKALRSKISKRRRRKG